MTGDTLLPLASDWRGRIAPQLPADPTRLTEDLHTLLTTSTPVADAQVIYRGRNLLYRTTLAGHAVIIKRFRCRGGYQRLLYRWRSSKAQRSFHHAQALLDAGFCTPTPWAFAERRQGRELVDSVYICAWLPGCHEIRALLNNPDYPDRTDHLYRVGQLVGRLHQAGILHRDLTPGNVLISDAKQPGRYDMVDLNRMQFGPVSPRRGLRNLVGLDPDDTQGRLALIAGYGHTRPTDRRTAISTFWAMARRNALRLRLKRRSRRWRHGALRG